MQFLRGGGGHTLCQCFTFLPVGNDFPIFFSFFQCIWLMYVHCTIALQSAYLLLSMCDYSVHDCGTSDYLSDSACN